VLTFSPVHNLTLADMTPAEIEPIVHAWTQIYAAHLSPSSALAATAPAAPLPPIGNAGVAAPTVQARYMQIFENKGAAMGCSNPHPHGQVWTTTGLPEEVERELAQLQAYRATRGGSHMLEDYAALELTRRERVVFANAAFVAVCPWWGVWPFETMVVARRHARALVDFSAAEAALLAEAVAEVTRRYDNLFETSFPYSMGIHQAPLDGTPEEVEASHFHMHFYPPLLRSATVRKFLVGCVSEMRAVPGPG
jgi:UDPglucose--hexose-1-phosphate uridylyltransferase